MFARESRSTTIALRKREMVALFWYVHHDMASLCTLR